MNENFEKALDSVGMLPDQAEQAWKETQEISFPANYSDIENIIVCGMGGSALPANVIQSLFPPRVPLVLVRDYHIPGWAGKKTLVVLSSYSGTTEETINCWHEAEEKGCLITGNTTGGKLAELFSKGGRTGYVFNPIYNPSGQPRIGVGYQIFGEIGIFAKLGLIEVSEAEIKEAIGKLRAKLAEIQVKAQNFSKMAKERAIIVFSAEFLEGNAHILANQTNETAKTFAAWFPIPEANHHLLEGLKYPKLPLLAIFLESEGFEEKIKMRFELTKEIIKKNGYETETYSPIQGTKIYEMLDCLAFSSFFTLLLAKIYNEDPTLIPWVDYFKKQLKGN